MWHTSSLVVNTRRRRCTRRLYTNSNSACRKISNTLELRSILLLSWHIKLTTIRHKSISNIASSLIPRVYQLILDLQRFFIRLKKNLIKPWFTTIMSLKTTNSISRLTARWVSSASSNKILKVQLSILENAWGSSPLMFRVSLPWVTFYLKAVMPRMLASISNKHSTITHRKSRPWSVLPMLSTTLESLKTLSNTTRGSSKSMMKLLMFTTILLTPSIC